MLYTVEALPSHLLQFRRVRTASLKPTLVLCLATAHCTVLLLCVAIGARAPFEGVRFLPSMRVAPEIQSWGEGPTSRESPYRVSCTFEALAKQKKMLLPKVV